MSSSIKKSVAKPKSTACNVVPGRKNRKQKNKKRLLKVERYFELEASESGDEGGNGGEEEEPENSSDHDFIVPDGEEEEGEEYTGPRMDWGDWDLLPVCRKLCVSHCRVKRGLKRLRRGDGSIPREETKTEEDDSVIRHLQDNLP